MSIDDIRRELEKMWAGHPAFPFCVAILEYVEHKPRGELEFLTFRSILNIVSRNDIDANIVAAINILCSDRISALESHMMFVDADCQEYVIEAPDFEEAKLTGALVHPESGDLVDDFEGKVFPFFTPTERVYL